MNRGLFVALLVGVAAAAMALPALKMPYAAGTAAVRPQHHRNASRLQLIKIDLDYKPKVRPEFGQLRGYDPVVATVHMGDRVQFINEDDAEHTASGFALTGQRIPAHYHFAGDPTVRKGRIIDASEWSTGNLRAHGGKSQVFIAKNPGNYFYACSYHLGQNMRGVIVVH
ncbi:MAG: plastocyanin/azurin family copper-binding protein [Candidatus Eremiobacteraeota bacterium]|nr:plastocyanin/azurin family copper-binding protein [Candidatus Eremiobacteraeota bacterium]